MIINPSKELLYAISDHMESDFTYSMSPSKFPENNTYGTAQLYTKDISVDVFNEILHWMKTIQTYFSTSAKSYKLDYDLFVGLFPYFYDSEKGEIHFRCDSYRIKPSVEDFFLFNEKS